jgi:hypothetical protein
MLEPHCVDALVVALMGADGAVAAGAALVVDDAEALAAAQGLGPRRPNLAAWPTDDGSVDAPTPTLVLGSAVHLVDRTAFLEAGGYTELLAAPEALGLDLAWRLRLAGHTAIHVPAARARCTVSPPPQARLRELRDLLATLMLDLGDETLDRLLPTLLVGTAAGVLERTAQTAALDLRSFDIDADAGGGGYPIPATGSDAAELVALRDVALRLPQLMDKREQVQARRRRPDDEILAELRPYRRPAPWSTRTMTTVAETMGAAKLFAVARAGVQPGGAPVSRASDRRLRAAGLGHRPGTRALRP